MSTTYLSNTFLICKFFSDTPYNVNYGGGKNCKRITIKVLGCRCYGYPKCGNGNVDGCPFHNSKIPFWSKDFEPKEVEG
jgi:hypothetical protein